MCVQPRVAGPFSFPLPGGPLVGLPLLLVVPLLLTVLVGQINNFYVS